MASVFSRIIAGELPGRFVWKDEVAVAFLTIAPLTDGHTLVVPREEIDKWTDASTELLCHLSTVAQTIGRAQVQAFNSERAGLEIAGFEVPHLHMHVWPVNSLAEFSWAQARQDPPPELLERNAVRLREQLRADGHTELVPQS